MNPIFAPSLKDRIVEILREEIFSGNMKDGDELTQEIVSAQLDVSRMPVREAFAQLEAEGVLERLQNRHIRVIGITAQRIRQNFSILAAIEGELAVQLVALRPKDAAIVQSFTHYKSSVPLQGREKCIANDALFHLQFSLSLDNQYLHQLHKKQRGGFFAFCMNTLEPNWKCMLALNEKIYTAFMASDTLEIRKTILQYYNSIAELEIKEKHFE